MTETTTQPKSTCIACRWESDVPFTGLCNRCTNQLGDALDGIRDTWYAAHGMVPTSSMGSGGSHAYGSKPPASINALSWIEGTDILLEMHFWERMVREERGLIELGQLGAVRHLDDEIDRAWKFHKSHLDWTRQQPWADEMLTDLRKRHLEGKVAARLTESRLHITCPTDHGTHTCGQHLTIPDDPDEPIPCKRCGTQWRKAWLERVAFDQAQWLDATFIELAYRITGPTLRRWAANGHVRKQRTTEGVVYNAADLRHHLRKTGRQDRAVGFERHAEA